MTMMNDTTSITSKSNAFHLDLTTLTRLQRVVLPNKTLNIALAGTGVGKSLFMCSFASSVLLQGKNVLYITLEMAEERIAERIDANLTGHTYTGHSRDTSSYV